MRHLLIALQNYHDCHQALPPAYVADDNGNRLHSWRVLLLPYLDESRLHEAYDFSEPWDGPKNRRLLAKTPEVYTCPLRERSGTAAPGRTNYFAVVGDQTAWPRAVSRKLADITDGASRTLILVESATEEVFWSEPRDLDLEQTLLSFRPTNRNIGTWHTAGFLVTEYYRPHAGFADGSVVCLAGDVSDEAMRQLLIIDDAAPDRASESSLAGPCFRRINYSACVRLAVFVLLTLLPLPWLWTKRHPWKAGGDVRPRKLDSQ
jgi:hypothetical protein